VSCPRCGAPVEWRPENRYRPFCSERCKLLDLGAWANEEYRVPVEGACRGEDESSDDFESRWSSGTKS
jgi:endogenous inhibitor of DNA gyrase (YacG/DUF329 family)